MKKSVWMILAAFALIAAPIGFITADEDAVAKEVELTGEPIDLLCYFSGKSGESHAACAAACVKGGKPAGLLVTTGEGDDAVKQIYLVVPPKDKKTEEVFDSLWGTNVTVKGKVTSKDGIKVIEVAEAMAAK